MVPFLAIDLGGGSTEFVFGRDSPEYAVSIDIGSVRLTERCLGRLPAPLAAIERARVEVDRLFAAVAVPSLPKTAVGVGGTFTSLAAILLDLELYEPASGPSFAVRGRGFRRTRRPPLTADSAGDDSTRFARPSPCARAAGCGQSSWPGP